MVTVHDRCQQWHGECGHRWRPLANEIKLEWSVQLPLRAWWLGSQVRGLGRRTCDLTSWARTQAVSLSVGW